MLHRASVYITASSGERDLAVAEVKLLRLPHQPGKIHLPISQQQRGQCFDRPSLQTLLRQRGKQGLGLFGSPEDASLLDEVVSIAYQERRRPSKRETTL